MPRVSRLGIKGFCGLFIYGSAETDSVGRRNSIYPSIWPGEKRERACFYPPRCPREPSLLPLRGERGQEHSKVIVFVPILDSMSGRDLSECLMDRGTNRPTVWKTIQPIIALEKAHLAKKTKGTGG